MWGPDRWAEMLLGVVIWVFLTYVRLQSNGCSYYELFRWNPSDFIKKKSTYITQVYFCYDALNEDCSRTSRWVRCWILYCVWWPIVQLIRCTFSKAAWIISLCHIAYLSIKPNPSAFFCMCLLIPQKLEQDMEQEHIDSNSTCVTAHHDCNFH